VICILGEAGVGKTRLVEELTTEASDHRDFVLTARAWEFERDLTFGPWVEVLRAGLGPSPQESVRKLEPVWQDELARLLPELGHASSRPAGDPLRLFEAVGRCLARLAAHRPLLLVLEDLHWADEPSLRLFMFLARRIATLPVLMIGTAREEELRDVPVLAGFLQTLEPGLPVQVMALPPLTEGDTLALAHQVARPGAPLAVVAWRDNEVWRLSQGNPFVVVETLRALETSDVPAAGAPVTLEVFRTRGVELRLHLPSRVREVILARFARLGTVSRDLASLAAVVGRECDFALLEGAAGLDASATAAGVEELVRERWLQCAGMRFEFTHDRVREVVYDRLLPPERARLHRLIASTIERLHGDDLGSHHVALAAHFRVGEVWDKAAEHLAWAGLQAGARSANREAAGFFEHALETLQRLPGGRRPRHLVIDLHIALEHSLLLTGALGLAYDNLHVAETTAAELGDRRRLGWVANYLSEYFRTIGDQTRAIEFCERALAAGDDMGDRTLQAEARLRLGQAYHARGDYARGAELLRDNTAALDEPVSDGNDRSFLGALTGQRARAGLLTVLSRTWLVWCLAELGEFSEGIAHAEEAVRLAEDASGEDPFRAMLAHLALGRVWLRKGEGLRALPALERCRELERVGNFKVWSPSVASTLGYALVSCGRLEEAIGLLRESIDQASSMNTLFGHSLRLAYLGEALLLSGHADEAVGHAVQALEVATACRERGHEAYARRLLAEATAAREVADVDAAVTAYQAAIELVDELRMRPLLAQCHEGLGRLYQRSARHREADEHLTTAADLCRNMGMRLLARPVSITEIRRGSPA
jgi:tetratricopeptide (TPR) repeat protein